MNHKRLLLLLLLAVMLVISVAPVLAQAPYMVVTPVWRPGEQLTSISGDDRYVDIQFLAQSNVQFWTTSISCRFGFATYLDNPTITWGPDWGVSGTDYTALPPAWDATPNILTITATRQGTNTPPMGYNGQNYTTLLATVRMQVVDAPTNANVPIVCSVMNFLDRDGRLVARATQSRTAPLAVRTGYTLTGTAMYQGFRAHPGITVACTNTDTATSLGQYVTAASGAFIFTARDYGKHTCTFTTPYDTFLDAEVAFNLQTPTFNLLPVMVRSGDTETSTSADTIGNADIATITGNFGTVQSTFLINGDLNADRIVNEVDLALAAANYGMTGPTDGSHLLYGLANNYGGTWPNSRIYWGDPLSGALQPLIISPVLRDFWPDLSPSGTAMTFIRTDARGTNYLMITNTVGVARPRLLTPARGFTYDSFAPSWSPDGQRVAFICASNGETTGYQFNEGNLCIINADGSNFQVLDNSAQVKIYPPAWYDNNTIIYAGTQADAFLSKAGHPTCPGKLCSYDVNQNTISAVDPSNVFGSATDFADMPAISFDGVNTTPVLLYRFYDSGATRHTLRAAYISGYDSASQTYTIAPAGTGNHTTIWNDADFPIDYYAVSPNLSVIFTTYDRARLTNSNEYYTPPYFRKTTQSVLGSLSWLAVAIHNVDGFVGNPLEITGPGAVGLWDGDYSTPTLLHVHRATVDWVP